MTTKPITPAQARQKKIDDLPELVIRAVNSLLTADYCTFGVTKLQEAFKREIEAGKEKYPNEETRPWYYKVKEYPREWYDFEPIFQKAGWNVSYDRPGYNESGETTWTFSAN